MSQTDEETGTRYPVPELGLDTFLNLITEISHQRWFGEACVLTNSAEALLDASATQYMEAGTRWEQGEPFTVADDSRIRGIAMHAGKLAFDAIDILFRTSERQLGDPPRLALGRCYRDGSVYKTHIGAQYDLHYMADAKVRFGLPAMI
jgi:3-hydroxy-9,10-secoandrosta-1,3,5(10)-triene-9,17-dione monooxygenase